MTVTVPPPPTVAVTGPSDQELFQRNMKDIYFNYDRYDVRAEDTAALKADADFLTAHPSYKVVISGHCDERGSEDYNVALGSNRADGVRDQLVKLGIARDRVKTISYGKEKPAYRLTLCRYAAAINEKILIIIKFFNKRQ